MHTNTNIEMVTVQVVVDDEHSTTITTVKPDVIVILRADRGIVIVEWIKTRYTDVQLNLDRICVCTCCFHAEKCQPQQTESRLSQFMQIVAQAPNLATAENIVVGSQVYFTCGEVFRMGTVSKFKNGGGNENQIIQMQDKLVEVGQSWVTRDEREDGFVLEKLGFSHQGTDRITSDQDRWDILTPEKKMTDEIFGNLLTVSIYGHSKELQLRTSLTKTWILNVSLWNKWHKANTGEEASGQRWVYLVEEPVWGNQVLRQEMTAFLDEMHRNNKPLSLSLEELNSLNCNHLTTDDFIRGQVGFYTTLQGHECAPMIKKARPQVPLHLLDHMIMPIHVGNNH